MIITPVPYELAPSVADAKVTDVAHVRSAVATTDSRLGTVLVHKGGLTATATAVRAPYGWTSDSGGLRRLCDSATFGAGSDDTVELTDAIAEVSEDSTHGGYLHLPPSVVRVSNTIDIPSGVRIIGASNHFPVGGVFTDTDPRFIQTNPDYPVFRFYGRVYHAGLSCVHIIGYGTDSASIAPAVDFDCGTSGGTYVGDQQELALSNVSIGYAYQAIRIGRGYTHNESHNHILVDDCLIWHCARGVEVSAYNATGIEFNRCAVALLSTTDPDSYAFHLKRFNYLNIRNCSGAGFYCFVRADAFSSYLMVSDMCEVEGAGRFLELTAGAGAQYVYLRNIEANNHAVHIQGNRARLVLQGFHTQSPERGGGIVVDSAFGDGVVDVLDCSVGPEKFSLAGGVIVNTPTRKMCCASAPLGFPATTTHKASNFHLQSHNFYAPRTGVYRVTLAVSGFSGSNNVNGYANAGGAELAITPGAPGSSDTILVPTTYTQHVHLTQGAVFSLYVYSSVLDTLLVSTVEPLFSVETSSMDPDALSSAVSGITTLLGVAGSPNSPAVNAAAGTRIVQRWNMLRGSALIPDSAVNTHTLTQVGALSGISTAAAITKSLRLASGSFRSLAVVARAPVSFTNASVLVDSYAGTGGLLKATVGANEFQALAGAVIYVDGVATRTMPTDGHIHTFAVVLPESVTGVQIGGDTGTADSAWLGQILAVAGSDTAWDVGWATYLNSCLMWHFGIGAVT